MPPSHYTSVLFFMLCTTREESVIKSPTIAAATTKLGENVAVLIILPCVTHTLLRRVQHHFVRDQTFGGGFVHVSDYVIFTSCTRRASAGRCVYMTRVPFVTLFLEHRRGDREEVGGGGQSSACGITHARPAYCCTKRVVPKGSSLAHSAGCSFRLFTLLLAGCKAHAPI